MKNIPWLQQLFLPLQQLRPVSVLLLIPDKMRDSLIWQMLHTFLVGFPSILSKSSCIFWTVLSLICLSLSFWIIISNMSRVFSSLTRYMNFIIPRAFSRTQLLWCLRPISTISKVAKKYFSVSQCLARSLKQILKSSTLTGTAQTVRGSAKNLRLLCSDYFFYNFESCISLFWCQNIFFFVSTCWIGSFLGFSCEWSKYFCVIKWCTLNRF